MEKLNKLANFFTLIGVVSTTLLIQQYIYCLEDDITTISISELNDNSKNDFKKIIKYSRKENKRLFWRLMDDRLLPWSQKPVIIKGKIDD
jgi:hypothetical protein